jgi:hypothetical protein
MFLGSRFDYGVCSRDPSFDSSSLIDIDEVFSYSMNSAFTCSAVIVISRSSATPLPSLLETFYKLGSLSKYFYDVYEAKRFSSSRCSTFDRNSSCFLLRLPFSASC